MSTVESKNSEPGVAEPHFFPSWWEVALTLFFLFVIGVIVAAGQGADLSWVRHLPGKDFTGHIAIFGTLAFLWRGVSRGGGDHAPWDPRSWPRSCWILAALVVGEELSQIWWPHRTFSASDLVADGIGLWLGFGLAGWLRRRR